MGFLDYAVDDYEVVDTDEHPGKVLICPKGKDGQTLYGRLKRGDTEDEPVEEPFRRLPGTGGSHRGD